MDKRKLQALENHRRRLRKMGSDLGSFDHPRISLPIGEALRHVAQAEAFLADAVDTARAELRPKE